MSVWNFTKYKSSRQAFFYFLNPGGKESRWLSQTDNQEMFLLQESSEKYGILNPLIVRPVPDGYYEIICLFHRGLGGE